MSFTGVDSLDRSIEKTNAWLKAVADGFGTEDRRFAYRVTRAWLHCLRDRLTVEVAAHFGAQLPEMLRGLYYDGWNPSHMPVKYDRDQFAAKFAREARVHDADVRKAAAVVTRVVREHMSAGAVDQAFALLPAEVRELIEPEKQAPTRR